MKKIVNTTPHSVRMTDLETGEVYEVPSCGTLINAKPIEEPAGKHTSGAELARVKFTADPQVEEVLADLERENPDAIIIGSIIAAQGFPGRVFGLIATPGFERVAPAEKRMRDDKFTAF